MLNLNTQEIALIEKGLARIYRGRLIPIMRGGSGEESPIFPAALEDIAAATDEDLQAFVDESMGAIEAVAADPHSFVNEELSSADLRSAMLAAVEAVEAANAELAAREAEEPETETETETEEEDLAAVAAELAARALASETTEEPEPDTPADPVEPEAVVAAAVAARSLARLPRPAMSRRARPAETETVALVAAAGLTDVPLGQEFPDLLDVARAMIRRRHAFGIVAEGASGQEPIARADWSHLYPNERILGGDIETNQALIAAALDPASMKREMQRRKQAASNGALVASGGLCAPVTPYYQLAMLSQASRPVRGALPSFSADRGGIRFARPAALSAVTTGVGEVTAAYDQQGGTFATKTCQVISCPSFTEQDVEVIFHCLQFGNLGARAFPELVAQWNNLVLAAQARTAESHLLTQMVAASTAITAQNLGLGASGALLGQILTAANALRSRHRMDPEAILRLMMPGWALDLLLSDVIRGQFQRFDSTEESLTALLRSFDIEPTFYIDGAAGKSQVYGAQGAGALLPFPATVNWLLFPEGSFLYLDGGTLELGLVRDSVLNKTNDFQIFGETFEDVAFVGVESYSVVSTVCDNGTVAAPRATVCPIDYTHST